MDGKYWWSRFGDFDAGRDGYPHMGQVLAYYRLKRGFRKQDDLAIALGYSKRTIEDLEGTMNLDTPDSVEKRKTLARLLRIPPALLALDWHFLVSQEDIPSVEQAKADVNQLMEENTFTLYQNILLMGRGYLYNGGPPYAGEIIDESVNKLFPIVRHIPAVDKEAWQELLCRFYLLSTSFALRRLQPKEALIKARKSIEAATEIENANLLASAHYRRARIYLDLKKVASTPTKAAKYLASAREDVDVALGMIDRVGSVLRGNIYLIAAEVYALGAFDVEIRTRCRNWQEKATTLVYKGDVGEDDTFLILNLTGLHHEKAKTLQCFGYLKEAHTEIVTARKTLPPDVLTWHINLNLTEAAIYQAEGNVEASAQLALEAYRIAKVVHSYKDEEGVKKLFLSLQQMDEANPYVCNLGLNIGMY